MMNQPPLAPIAMPTLRVTLGIGLLFLSRL